MDHFEGAAWFCTPRQAGPPQSALSRRREALFPEASDFPDGLYDSRGVRGPRDRADLPAGKPRFAHVPAGLIDGIPQHALNRVAIAVDVFPVVDRCAGIEE